MQPPGKKSPLPLPANPLKRFRSCQVHPLPPLLPPFGNFGTRFKKQKGRCRLYGDSQYHLFVFPFLHKSRYAHVLESLFNNILGLTVAVLLLTTVFFSSYLTSLHKFKNLKRTVFKDLWHKYKYLRLKSPKYKAKRKLQKNYII